MSPPGAYSLKCPETRSSERSYAGYRNSSTSSQVGGWNSSVSVPASLIQALEIHGQKILSGMLSGGLFGTPLSTRRKGLRGIY